MFHACRSAIFLIAIIASPTVVHAAAPEADNSIDHLVIGDSYWLRVDWGGVQQDAYGDLMKVTDGWIVVRSLSEGRNEVGVPVASKLPYVGRLFKNVGIGQTNEYTWVPREAATIRGRLRAAKPTSEEPPLGDEPSLHTNCSVSFVGPDQKLAEHEGRLEAITNDRLSLLVRETVSREIRKPGANLPVVGGYFVETRNEVHESIIDIPRNKVFGVRIRVPRPLAEEQANARQ